MKNKKLSNSEKVVRVIVKADEIEEKAKMKEQILNTNAKTTDPRDSLKINDMLVYSIKAKLALLEKFQNS